MHSSTPMFIEALFTVAKGWKQPKYLLMDERTHNVCSLCVHTMQQYSVQYYSAFKREEILTYATIWVNFEDIILSKRSQSHLYESPLTEIQRNIEQTYSQKQEGWQGLVVKGKQKLLFNGYSILVLQDEKVLEIAYIRMSIYLTQLNHTLKNGRQ